MKNELITKEELLNAGFEESQCNAQFYTIKIPNYIITGLGINFGKETLCIVNERLNSSEEMIGKKPTKKNINDAHVMFTGQDLDFTPKQKDYSWEAVLYRKKDLRIIEIKKVIDELLNLPNAIGNKLIAMLKLHYIIDELDRDFEAHYCNLIVSMKKGELIIVEVSPLLKSDTIIVGSKEAAEILMSNHAQLLKDALGVK